MWACVSAQERISGSGMYFLAYRFAGVFIPKKLSNRSAAYLLQSGKCFSIKKFLIFTAEKLKPSGSILPEHSHTGFFLHCMTIRIRQTNRVSGDILYHYFFEEP
ncbi:hypothetical protein SAMN04488128_107162 [Chitinophaga eiseniae]|uniref:Uncharacterized protein n=1 Tax=Chitinophaga eiseniae TaxID=634771 RepID=A0A1T4U0D3_9BACT|nr:hypothetical protein SAMN04488128_107162 [Chitinophaga eiseniae]